MFGRRKLKGHRIAVLAADGFEKVELSVPEKALRAAGARVDILSLRNGRIRGVNLHEPAGRFRVDRVVHRADPADYDGLFIPGGFISPDLLRQSGRVRNFVREFDQQGKPIAVICHGPWVLASAELVEGRRLTSWPGIRDDLVHAGAVWLDKPVVRDGNWISSRGPQDIPAFTRALIEHFAEGPVAISEGERPAAMASAPQRQEPPRLPITAMSLLPRPSFRTMVGLGAVIGAALLFRRRRRLRGRRAPIPGPEALPTGAEARQRRTAGRVLDSDQIAS